MITQKFQTLGEWQNKKVQHFHKEKILIRKPEETRAKIQQMIMDGPENFQIVSDFDHTVTSFNYNEQHALATFSVYRASELSPENFRENMQYLYLHYAPIEKDQTIKFEKKKQLMDEWYDRVSTEFKHAGFTTAQSLSILNEANIALRPKFDEFFAHCQTYQVPYYIVSGGLDLLCTTLLNSVVNINLYRNLYILANELVFKQDIITHVNMKVTATTKSDKMFEVCPIPKKNIILLGDLPSDYYMASKYQNINLLSIAFVSESQQNQIHDYINLFDISIIGEPSYLIPQVIIDKILNLPLSNENIALIQEEEYETFLELL